MTKTSAFRNPEAQLKFAAALTVGFALMIAFGSHARTDWPLRWFADLLFWPLGDPVASTDETQLLAAILGGVMAGWGVLFWLLTDALAESQPALLRRLVLISISVWFVIDGVGSIASGGWLNLVGNLGFLVLYIVPARRLV